MTNQAIIIVEPNKNKDLLFKELNGKIFLHYQLSYLSDNLFKKIVFLEPQDTTPLKSILGDKYLDMQLEFVPYKNISESGALIQAFQFIDDIYAFVFDAHQYFRINFGKADDFRRMRDSRLLPIGKKSENYISDSLPYLQLNEKGQIENISTTTDGKEPDTFFTNTWLINKVYFNKLFGTSNTSLLDILISKTEEDRAFCLACRQYFTIASSEKELEKLENDIKEYHYQ